MSDSQIIKRAECLFIPNDYRSKEIIKLLANKEMYLFSANFNIRGKNGMMIIVQPKGVEYINSIEGKEFRQKIVEMEKSSRDWSSESNMRNVDLIKNRPNRC